jgi:hypothetical protein
MEVEICFLQFERVNVDFLIYSHVYVYLHFTSTTMVLMRWELEECQCQKIPFNFPNSDNLRSSSEQPRFDMLI